MEGGRDAVRKKWKTKGERERCKSQERKKELFKKARPGVEREMKMNERCSSRMWTVLSSLLQRRITELPVAIVIKFSPRLSQLQLIDSLLFCFFPPSLCPSSLPSVPQQPHQNFISGVAMKRDTVCEEVWRHKEEFCVWAHACICGYSLCVTLHAYLWNIYSILFFFPPNCQNSPFWYIQRNIWNHRS